MSVTHPNTDDSWAVERHGGMTRGAGSKWRIVATGNEATCREVYENHRIGLRQGSVKLFNPAGEVVRQCSAPRFRTRW